MRHSQIIMKVARPRQCELTRLSFDLLIKMINISSYFFFSEIITTIVGYLITFYKISIIQTKRKERIERKYQLRISERNQIILRIYK